MKCENCGNEHDGSYGSGRFCSEKCKQIFVGFKEHPCKCKFCGKTFKNGRSLGGHVPACKQNPNKLKNRKKIDNTRIKNFNQKNPFQTYSIICQNCGKVFVVNLRKKQFEQGNYNKTCSNKCAHSRKHTNESRQKQSKSIKKFIQNHGSCGNVKPTQTKLIKCICEECGKEFQIWNKRYACGKRLVFGMFSKRFCSRKCLQQYKNKIIQRITKLRCERGEFGGNNCEAYRKNKCGWYKGIYCGSSWELAFVLWKTYNGFTVQRSNKILPYEYNGKTLNYYPDYEIDGITYEIKGFEDDKSLIKHQTYPWIEYYNKTKMKPIIKQVKKIFGNNFTQLLEQHK